MRIHVLLFGPARLMAGKQELALDLPNGATVRDAINRIFHDYPQLQKAEDCLRYALDAEYVEPEKSLRDGQTLVLIPPVQGG